jgi:hypothetical protein
MDLLSSRSKYTSACSRKSFRRCGDSRGQRLAQSSGAEIWPKTGHTAVSIMTYNGIRIQEISDAVSRKPTYVTETVYRDVSSPRSAAARRSWTVSSKLKTL